MHLPNGDHIARFSGVPDDCAEVKVQSNGTVQVEENSVRPNSTNGAIRENGQAPSKNEIQIPIAKALDADALLDIVLTAWTVLIQRYQRDVFHQFTWGAKDGTTKQVQCIPTPDLDLKNQSTAASLKSKIIGLRLKDIPVEGSSIFLNDGTKEEVGCFELHCSQIINTSVVDLSSFS